MIQFKRGDTLVLEGCTLLDADGNAMPLANIGIKCQARTESQDLAIDFTVTKHADSFDLDAGDTSGCPLGLLRADIEYTEDGVITSTQDFSIVCKIDRTYE